MPRKKKRLSKTDISPLPVKVSSLPKEPRWSATFLEEKGDPITGAAEVDGVLFPKGKPIPVSQTMKERLEKIERLHFSFKPEEV